MEKKVKQSVNSSCFQVFVLRFWQEPSHPAAHQASWRFVLEEPKTGQRHGFMEFTTLVDFLQEELKRQEAIQDEDG